jgi:hypothetical protein
MHRIYVLAGLVAVLGLLGPWTSGPSRPTPAAAGKQPAAAQRTGAAPSPRLPVTRVTLFSSGVGHFQREGEVQGSACVDLSFGVADVNDLLKSLVLQDRGGGRITAVGFDCHDPLGKALKGFALDLTGNPPLAQLLNQARGEEVEAGWQGQTLQGSVLGVERQRHPAGKDTFVEVDVLNLMTEEGLRAVPLKEVQRLRFLNAWIDAELKRALQALAAAHDTEKRLVRFHFAGEGKRQVKVGYVIEHPIWKTSYRLALEPDGKPYLQAWGIVENATDEDWENVRVVLVSGRPISFRMDLYQPLYVPRPVVEPELFAGLRPPTYGGPITARPEGKEAEAARKLADRPPGALAPERPARGGPLDLREGVPPVATGVEAGDYFQYVIEEPVRLGRQQSVLLPIAGQTVEGDRVSLYNQKVHAKHPLLGLRFRNTTGLHLNQGPVTVLENGDYAGDARLMDLQPGEERLLGYAMDLGVEVEPVSQKAPEQLTAVKIVKGILYATSRWRESKGYNVRNRTTRDRVLLIEHPFRPDWKLAGPEKPQERSRDVYRFQVAVPAGKGAALEVIEEQDRTSQVILATADDQAIQLYLTGKVISRVVRQALEEAVELRTRLAETQQEIAGAQREMRAILEDQARLRANLERVPPTSAAYQRYLKKFDEQEPQIEKLQEQLRKLAQQEADRRKAYETFLLGVNVE